MPRFFIRTWPVAWQIGLFLLLLALQASAWVLLLLAAAGLPLAHLLGGGPVPAWGQTAYVVGLYGFILLDICWLQQMRQEPSLLPGQESPRLRLLALGWAGGAGLLAGQYLIQVLLGWMHWQGAPGGWLPWLWCLPMALAFAWIEETFFRGWLLHVLQERPPWQALGWQALLYALAHAPSLQTAWPALSGLFLAGLAWGLMRLRTGSIWLGTGMHASWIYLVAASSQAGHFRFEPASLPFSGGAYPVAGLFSHLLLLGLVVYLLLGPGGLAGESTWKTGTSGIH